MASASTPDSLSEMLGLRDWPARASASSARMTCTCSSSPSSSSSSPSSASQGLAYQRHGRCGSLEVVQRLPLFERNAWRLGLGVLHVRIGDNVLLPLRLQEA
eukprot:scaffold1282_cov251-Pinguiococcus_pyrenoidosus.AAC.51